jgi:hypothetical protein
MGGTPEPPKPSDEEEELAEKQEELLEEQIKQAKLQNMQLANFKPEALAPLPPPPSPDHTNVEMANAEQEARRAAYRRTNTARNTIFAGETGSKTLLG